MFQTDKTDPAQSVSQQQNKSQEFRVMLQMQLPGSEYEPMIFVSNPATVNINK